MARILVVEDDPSTRQLVRLHLESDTHEVCTAEDGLQGLQQVLAFSPDLIVTDFRMPHLDGIGMLAAIRAQSTTATIPVIMLSSESGSSTLKRSRSHGVSDFLPKPLNRTGLLTAVTRQLAAVEQSRLAAREAASARSRALSGKAMPTQTLSALRLTPAGAAAQGQGSHQAVRTVEGTVLFFAICDFARVMERLKDAEHVRLVEAYSGILRGLVSDNGGWVVSVSDGRAIAMFEAGGGDPAGHALRALQTAIAGLVELQKFTPWVRSALERDDLPALAASAGLHSGPVSVCELPGVGSSQDGSNGCTIIGDTVNVASRLQVQGSQVGWSIISSASTVDYCAAAVVAGRRGQVKVKGREAALDAVEITGLRAAEDGADGAFGAAAGDPDSAAALRASRADAVMANTRLIEQQAANLTQAGRQSTLRGKTIDVAALLPPPAAPSPLHAAADPAHAAPGPAHAASGSPHAAQPSGAPAYIDGYQLLRKIGEGGVAEVYLASSAGFTAPQVLKLVRLSDADEGDTVQRFIEEYALLSQIVHPNVAQIFGQGFAGEYAYLAMEYFAGGDLRQAMQTGTAPEFAIATLIQVASGLGAVHAAGIVHRDLKPDNIMIRDDGSLAIADFGIAKHFGGHRGTTQHGQIVGTPYYLSPEQALGRVVDQRSDVYSLGVMFYELLTGSRAYRADTAMGLLEKHVHAPVPQLPESLRQYQELLEGMMRKDVEQRLPSAAAIIDAIMEGRLA